MPSIPPNIINNYHHKKTMFYTYKVILMTDKNPKYHRRRWYYPANHAAYAPTYHTGS